MIARVAIKARSLRDEQDIRPACNACKPKTAQKADFASAFSLLYGQRGKIAKSGTVTFVIVLVGCNVAPVPVGARKSPELNRGCACRYEADDLMRLSRWGQTRGLGWAFCMHVVRRAPKGATNPVLAVRDVEAFSARARSLMHGRLRPLSFSLLPPSLGHGVLLERKPRAPQQFGLRRHESALQRI